MVQLGDKWCELDAAVHVEVMGYPEVVGEHPCSSFDWPDTWTIDATGDHGPPVVDDLGRRTCPDGLATVIRPVAWRLDYSAGKRPFPPVKPWAERHGTVWDGPIVLGRPSVDLEPVPCYSEYLPTAWRVVEEMARREFRLILSYMMGGIPGCVAQFVRSGSLLDPFDSLPTPAEAICRAALAAVRKVGP